MSRFGSSLTSVLLLAASLVVFAAPAGASVSRGFNAATVCAKDLPSAALLKSLVGVEEAPDCVNGGADGGIEIYISGTTGAVGYYIYSASKAHKVQAEVEGEFNGRLHKRHLAALGKEGTVWTYKGKPGDAWFTRGGQFVWIDGTLTSSADVIPVAKAIYAKIG